MKNFEYDTNRHYLFTDGKIRKPYFGFDGMATFENVLPNGEKATYDSDGKPSRHNRRPYASYPDIALCIEDPTSWHWRMVVQGIKQDIHCLIAEFVIEGRIFTVSASRVVGERFKLAVDGVYDSPVLFKIDGIVERILELNHHQTLSGEKKKKLLERYENMLKEAEQIKRELENLP